MRSFDTVTEAIQDLKLRGFNLDFNLKDTRIECITTGTQLATLRI